MTMHSNNFTKIVVPIINDGSEATMAAGENIRFSGPEEEWIHKSAIFKWRMIHNSPRGDSKVTDLCYIDLVHLRNAIDALLIAHEGKLQQTP